MALHPELVGRDILVADAQAAGMILVDDRRELFHLKPLLIPATNLLYVGNDMGEVILAGMNDVVAGGHGRRSLGLAAGAWTKQFGT